MNFKQCRQNYFACDVFEKVTDEHAVPSGEVEDRCVGRDPFLEKVRTQHLPDVLALLRFGPESVRVQSLQVVGLGAHSCVPSFGRGLARNSTLGSSTLSVVSRLVACT